MLVVAPNALRPSFADVFGIVIEILNECFRLGGGGDNARRRWTCGCKRDNECKQLNSRAHLDARVRSIKTYRNKRKKRETHHVGGRSNDDKKKGQKREGAPHVFILIVLIERGFFLCIK